MNITLRGREEYFYFSLYILCFSIPFDNNFSNSLIGVSVILWIYTLPKIDIRQKWKDYKIYIILFALPLLIHATGLLHTDNFATGISRFEARLAHLIFPVIIFTSNLGKEQFTKAGYFLCLGVLTTSAICLAIGYRSFLQVPDSSLYSYITYETLLKPLDLHANFYPLFPCFACLFLIHETVFESHSRWLQVMLSAFALYMLAVVFLIQSRAPIAALTLILIVSSVYWVIRNPHLHRFTKTSVVMVLVVFVGWFISSKSLHGRFSFSIKEIQENMNTPDGLMPKPILSIVEHLRCWYCATSVLSDYHFFTGYGTGDERDVLTQCYQANGWTNMASAHFTSHNEYFSSLIRNGLIEFLILIILFLIPFYQSLRANDLLYASFILLWILILLFSSLHRQSLITFYTLFNSLLFKIMLQRRELMESDPGKSIS